MTSHISKPALTYKWVAVLNKQPAQHSYPHPLTPQYYLAELASPEDTDILVSQRDFDQAFCNLVPSVSRSEMDHYAEIQRTFSRLALPSSTASFLLTLHLQ